MSETPTSFPSPLPITPKQLPDDFQVDAQTAVSFLLELVAGARERFLNYLEECDRDPTLVKVAFCVSHKVILDIGQVLVRLAQGRFAQALLDGRPELRTPAMTLAALDDVYRRVRKTFPTAPLPERFEQETPRSLALIRAGLLVRSIVGENGERLFTDDDEEALSKKSPLELDRLYTVAARLNAIPLPTDRQGGGDGAPDDGAVAPESNRRRRFSKAEAENAVKDYLKKYKARAAKGEVGIREINQETGVSIGSIQDTDAWTGVQDRLEKVGLSKRPRRRKAQAFTPAMDSVAEDVQLAKLTAEQAADDEGSPLNRGGRGKVRVVKRF
jgi:hypothetical protein